MHFEFDIARNNRLDIINWPNHLRIIKVITFTKAFRVNSIPRLGSSERKNIKDCWAAGQYWADYTVAKYNQPG